MQLWRLDAPGNERWTGGDQLQRTVKVPAAGLKIEDLPGGRYRVYAPSLRSGADDPPAFEASGPWTTVTLPVPICREHRVLLEVHDETGALVRKARRYDLGRRHTSSGTRPAWRRSRRRRNGSEVVVGIGGGAGSFGRREHRTAAGPRGFDLGLHREDSRERRVVSWHRFKFADGWSTVRLDLTRTVMRERTYVAVTVPAARVLESVLLPDGTAASGVDKAEVLCQAALVAEGVREPSELTVRVPGFEDLRFPYRPGDRFPLRRLTPKKR